MTTWDVLIPTIPHRHAQLVRLLAELDGQLFGGIFPQVGVRVYRDNLEARYGAKCSTLIHSSGADYVSFVDDDDAVAGDYFARICEALETGPDYVGFPIAFTVDGEPAQPVEHSLRYSGWANSNAILTRDFVHKNPIRRELAEMGTWGDHLIADQEWADSLRARVGASGMQLREEWIPEPMYHYRMSTTDSMTVTRDPLPASELQPLPSYPWLVYL